MLCSFCDNQKPPCPPSSEWCWKRSLTGTTSNALSFWMPTFLPIYPLSTQVSAHVSNTFHASYIASWEEKPRITGWKLDFTDFSNPNTFWKLPVEELTFLFSFLFILTSERSEEQQPHLREVRAVYRALWKQKGSSRSFQWEQYVLAQFLDTTPATPASSAPPTLTHRKSRWKIFCQKTLKYSVRKLLS